jgi:2-oxoglutarate dehydrogenase E2 component (dihydrolipoamide succinyltransferase)
MQFVARRIFSKAFKASNTLYNPSLMMRHNIRFFASKIVKCPTMGDSITEGTVQEYTVQAGEFVSRDDVIAVIETDKVMVDIRAPEDGVIIKYFVSEGDTIEVSADFFEIDPDAKGSGAATPATPKTEEKKEEVAAPKASTPAPKATEPATKAPTPSPAAKSSPPTKSEPAKRPAAPKGAPPPPGMQVGKEGLTTITGSRTETKVKLSRMRQTIAKRLKDAQNTTAMLTTFNEVDMGAFMDLRKQFQSDFQKKHGVKLGFMGAFVRGVVQAVKEQPVCNAVIVGDEIIYRDYVDISVAVSTPAGLVVPVLRNCETMSYAGVEQSLLELSIKARDGKISMDDMKGGTFTITNGGVFGSMMGTPIINPPQSAILGMHAIKNRAVVVGDKIVARPIMYLALTYDHRLIDGREAVLFLRKIKECVEDPNNVLFDL